MFFSTYLESIWIGNYLAAAALLRASGSLEDATAQDVSRVADGLVVERIAYHDTAAIVRQLEGD